VAGKVGGLGIYIYIYLVGPVVEPEDTVSYAAQVNPWRVVVVGLLLAKQAPKVKLN
jgi:hypothetical protein